MSKTIIARVAEELAALYERDGGLDPAVVVEWARKNPDSALHTRFDWNDTEAAEKWRVLQARNLITEVEVTYPDGKKRQVYVSPIESRGAGGYVSLVDVLSDKDRRAAFLAQALEEYERVGEKYRDIKELASVRAAVRKIRGKVRGKRRAM